ncbi:MAG: TetR/AcrR family transcriptional regulator [Leptospiraceae bacterium]|nr:TetR/AcrR family transcriptional regulator [Leptospiraceae bacterium]
MDIVPKKKPRRSRNSLSQEEILDAAEDIVRTQGIAKLSMRNIAQKLSCSVASPYAHFDSLEEIAKGLIIRGEIILTGMLRKALRENDDTYDQLAGIARAYWQFSIENRELHKLMFHVGNELIHRKVLNVMPISYRIFLQTIKRGFQKGDFHVNRQFYPAVARTMWAWIYGLIVLELAGLLSERRDPLEEGIAIFNELLKTGWKGKEPDWISHKGNKEPNNE